MNWKETIYAVSTGRGRAGIIVVRFSGTGCLPFIQAVGNLRPRPRFAHLVTLRAPQSGDVIDSGLCLYFPGPASVTGEDVLELHLHGSPAVVDRLFVELRAFAGFRPADPGEFTRRAFVNSKLDLVEVEGLSDLLLAESEPQRRLAMRQFLGTTSRVFEAWREKLTAAIGLVEAAIDFSDEDDVATGALASALPIIVDLRDELKEALVLSERVAGLRDGVKVVIGGAPNVGKSTLLNTLVERDAAIVSAIPGTTRDVLEVDVRIAGLKVSLVDTAGLRRETTDVIEQEGMRRAFQQFADADVLIWMTAADCNLVWPEVRPPDLILFNKLDLGLQKMIQVRNKYTNVPVVAVSLKSGEGLIDLRSRLAQSVEDRLRGLDDAVVIRERQRVAAQSAMDILSTCHSSLPAEVLAMELRRAADVLATLTGRVGVEDFLGHIFSSFCIGK